MRLRMAAPQPRLATPHHRRGAGALPLLAAALLATQDLQLLHVPALSHCAFARNLPEANGASGKLRGTVEALVPIVKLESSVATAIAALPNLDACAIALNAAAPAGEKDFKRLFDEYSEGISYKQNYLDKNAFLVYYTQGFDGANRPSIETESEGELKQKAQFGARNDAWIGFDDAREEAAYLQSHPPANEGELKELRAALLRTKAALADYEAQAPPEQVEAARQVVVASGKS